MLATKSIVIVDPDTTTGILLIKEVQKRGILPVTLHTTTQQERSTTALAGEECVQQPTTEATAKACKEVSKGTNIIGCLAGGATGVALAHELQRYWNCHQAIATADDDSNNNNKTYRTLREARGHSLADLGPFLNQSDIYPIIVKAPEDETAAPQMYVCADRPQAEQRIQECLEQHALSSQPILCQESIHGTEYLVDHVSCDGIHKTVIVYEFLHDRANGSQRVPSGCRPVTNDAAIAFVRDVLDQNRVLNGPSFAHIIVPKDENSATPCLVSLHFRAHGGRWRPLCKAMTGGYSQVELTVDAMVDAKAFQAVPDRPKLQSTGEEVRLISFARGTVRSTPGFEVIQKLPSFVSIETNVSTGSQVTYTIDGATSVGSVLLLHPNPTVVQQDIQFIRYMQNIHGLFLLETKLENLKRPHAEQVVMESFDPEATSSSKTTHQRVFSSDGPSLIRHMSLDHPNLRKGLVKRVTTVDASQEAVLVIDPYSTGCLIAEEVQRRGYSVLALWTKGFSPAMKTHIPMSVIGKLKYDAEIDQQDDLASTAAAVAKAAGSKRVGK